MSFLCDILFVGVSQRGSYRVIISTMRVSYAFFSPFAISSCNHNFNFNFKYYAEGLKDLKVALKPYLCISPGSVARLSQRQ